MRLSGKPDSSYIGRCFHASSSPEQNAGWAMLAMLSGLTKLLVRMVRRALAQAAKLSTDFPIRPEATPPPVICFAHSKATMAIEEKSVHGLNLPSD